MEVCALITFLENFSENTFKKNVVDDRQRTILHKAASLGDIGVINGLLRDDANPDALDKDQCTPLGLAIRLEKYAAAECLIRGGADINKGGGIFGSTLHMTVVKLNIGLLE